MGNKPVLVAVAILAIVGSIAWIYFEMPGRRPSIQLEPYQALGQVAAEETVRLLNRQGQIVIIVPETPAGSNPVEEAKLKTFSGVSKKGGLSLASVEKFALPPSARLFGRNVPREWFLHVLQTHPKAAALVLFAEFPSLEQADADQLKKDGVKIILISASRSGAKRLVDDGLVQLAVVPRGDTPPQASATPQSTRETFDRYYAILTPGKTAASP